MQVEFQWYIEMRHKFLKKPLPRHFSVFVRNIPVRQSYQKSIVLLFARTRVRKDHSHSQYY